MTVTATVIMDQVRVLSDQDEATTTLSDTALLREIDSAHEYYFDILTESDEGFFETVHTASVVANSRDLSPPLTTTFTKIDLVERVDGNEDRPVSPIRKKKKYVYESNTGRATVNDQFRYYIEGNAIQLVPAPSAASTDAIEVTYVPEMTQLNSATAVTDLNKRWAKAITYRAIKALDLRLRDGREPGDVLDDVEKMLIKQAEGRQRQEPRRIAIEDDEGSEYDGIYLGS